MTAPTPVTPAAPSKPSRVAALLTKIRSEVLLIGGGILTVGEALSPIIPAGEARTLVQVLLPVVAAIVVRARTLPLPQITQFIAKITAKLARPKTQPKK